MNLLLSLSVIPEQWKVKPCSINQSTSVLPISKVAAVQHCDHFQNPGAHCCVCKKAVPCCCAQNIFLPKCPRQYLQLGGVIFSGPLP